MLYTHVKETHALVTQFLSGCRLNVMAEEQFVNLTELMDFKSLKFTQKRRSRWRWPALSKGNKAGKSRFYNEMIYNEVSYSYIFNNVCNVFL